MSKVSIIVPVYNAEKTINKCIFSIINQSFNDLEIICINDGSTDESLSILKDWEKKDDRVIVIDKQNEGVSKARNDGIKKSTGKYITFVDSDDYISKTEIEEMYDTIIKNKVEMVRVNYQIHNKTMSKIYGDKVPLISNRKLNVIDIKNEILPKILDGNLPCFSCLFIIKKETLMKTSLFPINIHMMEDLVLYIDLITKIKSLYILDKPLYHIVFNDNSGTNNINNIKRNIFDVITVNKIVKSILFKNKLDSIDNIIRINVLHSNAISDFIFKHYLSYDDTINLCRKLSNDRDFLDIFNVIDFKKINIQRKIILKCIIKNRVLILKVYLTIRKYIYKIKRLGD